MNKFSSQVENHNFYKMVMEDWQPVIKKVHQNKDYIPSENERYSLSVFEWAMKIKDCFETLEHARVFLNYFRINKWYKQAGIGRSDYINYHYFNYAITVIRIMDVALILANDTFRLGNPPRLCRIENIIENSWVCSTGIDELLKKLNSIVEPWRKPRNLFVHRGDKLDISGQRQDSDLLFLLEAQDLFSEQNKLIADTSPADIKRWYKSVVSGIFGEFDQTERPLLDVTSELFSELLPIYRFWYEMLTETSKNS